VFCLDYVPITAWSLSDSVSRLMIVLVQIDFSTVVALRSNTGTQLSEEPPMNVTVEIDPGICGFQATACVSTEDQQTVEINVASECELVRTLVDLWHKNAPIDGYQELGPEESVILKEARTLLQNKGCCEACVVPVGVSKAVQVATGLALPKHVVLKMTTSG
jgi:hypothetical protein